jgi:hypothetical protein
MSVLNALHALVEDDTLPDEDREQASEQFIAKLAPTVPQPQRLALFWTLVADTTEPTLIRRQAARWALDYLNTQA